MKKRLISFAALILSAIITVCQSPPAPSTPPEDPDRPLEPYASPSPRAYDAGHPLEQLRGSMCGDNFDPQNFIDLRAMGANLVRWQVQFDYGEISDLSIYEDPAVYAQWLEEETAEAEIAAAKCESLDMLMVIDLPSVYPGDPSGSDYTGNPIFTKQDSRDSFIRTWELLAERFKNSPAVWAFELLNEPIVPYIPGPLEENSDSADDIWNDLFLETTEHIRAIDPERFVIYDPILGCNPYTYIDFSPLPVDKIIYTIHMYTPFCLTFQGLDDSCTKAYSYPGYVFTNGWENWILQRRWIETRTWWNKEKLRQILQPVLDFQTANNVPIFVGEFSCVRWAPDNSAYRYIRDCIELFDEYNWDWSYHTFRSAHCWSVEHTRNKNEYDPSPVATDRFLLLHTAFQRNDVNGNPPLCGNQFPLYRGKEKCTLFGKQKGYYPGK